MFLLVLKHRVVLRLPSEEPNDPIIVYADPAFAADLIPEGPNKDYLDLFRRGQKVKYPGFDAARAEEDAWAKPLIQTSKRGSQPALQPVAPAVQPVAPASKSVVVEAASLRAPRAVRVL